MRVYSVCVFFLQLTMVPKCLPSLGPLPSTVNGPVWMIVQERSKPGFHSCLFLAAHKAKWGALSFWLWEGKALTGQVLNFEAGSVLWPSWAKCSCFSKWLRKTFVQFLPRLRSKVTGVGILCLRNRRRLQHNQLTSYTSLCTTSWVIEEETRFPPPRLRWTEPPPAWVSPVLALGLQEVSVILLTPFTSW